MIGSRRFSLRLMIVCTKNHTTLKNHGWFTIRMPPTRTGVSLVTECRTSFMAFFWGVKTEWVKAHLLPDGTGRLFNNTRWMNYGQEAHLKNTHPDMNIAGCLNSFARQPLPPDGATLAPKGWAPLVRSAAVLGLADIAH